MKPRLTDKQKAWLTKTIEDIEANPELYFALRFLDEQIVKEIKKRAKNGKSK